MADKDRKMVSAEEKKEESRPEGKVITVFIILNILNMDLCL